MFVFILLFAPFRKKFTRLSGAHWVLFDDACPWWPQRHFPIPCAQDGTPGIQLALEFHSVNDFSSPRTSPPNVCMSEYPPPSPRRPSRRSCSVPQPLAPKLPYCSTETGGPGSASTALKLLTAPSSTMATRRLACDRFSSATYGVVTARGTMITTYRARLPRRLPD